MSDNEEDHSHVGFDSTDHQPAYIYAPESINEATPERSAKRRKVIKGKVSVHEARENAKSLAFEPLLRGVEPPECVELRQSFFKKCWSETDARIQSILSEANEDTLTEVTAFVSNIDTGIERDVEKVPASFIVTGPNIASQGLLFQQLSARLRDEVDGPVVTLRSGDASNLKAVLKQLIRDATNQRSGDEELAHEQDGRKLLNYDLEILHGFVKAHGCQRVVVTIQDSEAFDTSLVIDLITLFSSWMDRIPFTLLFGIATSVELFQERLPRTASQCLYGVQVNVEQTSSVLEKIFQKAVMHSKTSLRLGSEVVCSMMERQYDHVQSVQSFIVALKYAYMCHFYGNALSVLTVDPADSQSTSLLQSYHLEAIRGLRSFKDLIGRLLNKQDVGRARKLLEDDNALMQEVQEALHSRDREILGLLRVLHVFAGASSESTSWIELYMTVFEGTLANSGYSQRLLESIKRMVPDDLNLLIGNIKEAIERGNPEMGLEGWDEDDGDFMRQLRDLETETTATAKAAVEAGKQIRSSDAIHSKGLRTTVIAQRVQLSYEKSTITEEESKFIGVVERLIDLLKQYFTTKNPKTLFLNEVWLYDNESLSGVFAPRPRAVIENALSAPHEYLTCDNTEPRQGLSSSHPATAILYQSYLEAGSLINVADLWNTFYGILSGREGVECDEREALMQFYRALADLKLLGMVKQSRKKADHLAKVAWKGL